MILQQLENGHLAVTIHSDAAADILDKATGARWRMGRVALQEEGPIDIGHVWQRTGRSICEQYPGRFAGTADNADIVYTLFGREGRPMGVFRCRYALDGPWLSCRIMEIDEALPSLVFPPPIESESLAVPMGVGRWIKKPLAERKYWTYPAHLNMRWFGGLRGENGWISVLDEGFCDSGALAAEMTIAPAWLKSLGRWSGSYTVKYRCTSGGYVGLARTFRAYAIENGLHKTLAEKMAEFPATRNLLGGRVLSFYQAFGAHPEYREDRMQPVPAGEAARSGTNVGVTHAQTARITEEARALGMERGLVNIRGWINGGYDESHPDIWPPEPALGTTEELKRLLAMADPIVSVLHDNYQDIYERAASWPKGVVRTHDGHAMPGGFWAGGQCYIINSRDGLAYAKRNWREIATLAPRGMFIDTTIAVQLIESYEAGNTCTRSEDMALKLDLLRFYREQGQTLGSEEGADFGVPLVDWIENRHGRIAGESIPLWPLVFHDAAFCTRYADQAAGYSKGGAAKQSLIDMLWGYMLLWRVSDVAGWERQRGEFGASGHADAWHARIGADDLVSHRYLTEDSEVEETVFSSGVAFVANFANEERRADGITIPAGGYVIRD